MKLKNKLVSIFALVAISVSSVLFAADEIFVNENGVTLSGYDTVAYFTENKAVEGSAEISAVYNGAIYRFSSEGNRDLFTANPAKYAPQYGGFCAYGAALGKKFDVNGKAFEVVDGKLYVNKNEDVYETWVEEKTGNITTADKKWTVIQAISVDKL